MSVNCINCVANDRTGTDLLCDACRAERAAAAAARAAIVSAVDGMPLRDAGTLLLAVAQAVLDKQNNYSPRGSLLMRLARQDGTLTVCLAKDAAAGMLAVAHDAIKKHVGG